MDAYHHHHHPNPRFIRPPPAPAPAPPPPPPPPDPYHQQWYPQSGHFQYSPSPPPPPQQQQQQQHQWGPPPPGSYPPPPPYSYPPPPSRFPPPPPPPPQQPFAQPNQDWAGQGWGHHHQHQGWSYQAQSNEEDWAAKARAWADANKATENQHQQPQFIPAGRVDEPSHYREQYPNSSDPHYMEAQHQSVLASSYQQVPTIPPHRPPVNLPPVGFDPSTYAPQGHLHAIKDGTSAPDSHTMILRQGNLPSPSVHQQEVPSSYSSAAVAGNNGGMLSMSNSTSQEVQHHLQIPLADRPLEFAPRFAHDNSHTQSSYPYLDPAGQTRETDTVATVPSMTAWTAPTHYPPISPVLPPGPQQHDPALAVPPGPHVPPFSSFPGSNIQPTVPSGGPPFALGAVNALQHNTVFSGDAYGVPSLPERPKKASVPNWLKEEIKKAVIATPLDHPKEESHSVEDEVVDRSFGRSDQEDSKSNDSSKSAEEDEEDEDFEDASRAAGINQEIKRVLTEVLLKVTDELFDEIATKVLNEDNPAGEDDKSMVIPNHKTSLPTSMLPTPKTDAKLLTPGKFKESETASLAEKSGSVLPGGILGLADYATDDDDDDGDDENGNIQSSRSTNSTKKDVLQLSVSGNEHYMDVNGSPDVQPAGTDRNKSYLERDPSKASSIESKRNSASGDTPEDATSGSKDIVGVVKSAPPKDMDPLRKTSKDNISIKEIKTDKNDRHESKKTSGKDFHKEEESDKIRADDEKNNGSHKRYDERHSRREKTDELNKSKDREKEHNARSLEKVHESESKKRSSLVDEKMDKKELERNHKGGAKEESSRKREHVRDKDDDRSRHKRSSDSSRNKKKRSSSVSRGRSSKDNSGHRDNDTSDDASNDSKRKPHSRRRSLSPSPSPVKSRRRQVSRSPHSKHSQRRHSPYSSHNTNRGRRSRSRSRSPMRRHR